MYSPLAFSSSSSPDTPLIYLGVVPQSISAIWKCATAHVCHMEMCPCPFLVRNLAILPYFPGYKYGHTAKHSQGEYGLYAIHPLVGIGQYCHTFLGRNMTILPYIPWEECGHIDIFSWGGIRQYCHILLGIIKAILPNLPGQK